MYQFIIPFMRTLCVCLSFSCAIATAQDWKFTDVTNEAGLNIFNPNERLSWISVSAGDIDGDQWTDLFVTKDGGGPCLLLRNQGDGTFRDIAVSARVAMFGQTVISSLLFDYDNDGHLDIFAAIRDKEAMRLFRNNGDLTFQEVSGTAGINLPPMPFSPAAGDYDRDGDLDLYLATSRIEGGYNHLWRNNGDGSFTDVGEAAGLVAYASQDLQFAPAFSDVNNDGWPDLLLVADFQTSEVFVNKKDGTFERTTQREVITDEGGMGSAVGDYDNDGDMDWFVSSIWDPEQDPEKSWGVSSGNRLYRNKGDGSFEDVTDETGVRVGYWGWGSTFGDFNNDGWLDIYHTNGYNDAEGPFFLNDPARFFLSDQQGAFSEISADLGLDDTFLGNGVVAFDFDHDGDLDLFVTNAIGGSRLYRNDGGNKGPSCAIRLRARSGNMRGIGAKVYLKATDGSFQMREVRHSSNFLSNNPAVAHFGLGQKNYDRIDVVWPDGTRNALFNAVHSPNMVFPKIEVSYDSDLNYFAYMARVTHDLEQSVWAGIIDNKQAVRFRFSALKAYILEHYGAP